MTQIADARRVRVHPGDVALVCGAATAVFFNLTTDFVVRGADSVIRDDLDLEIANALYLVFLLLGGLVSVRLVGQRGNGRLMLLAALSLGVQESALTFAAIGPLAFLADAIRFAAAILIGHLLLRWPRSRLQNRAQRWAVVAAWVLPTGLNILGDFFYSPAAHKWATPAWWPMVVRDDAAFSALANLSFGTFAALLVVFLVLVVARLQQASGPERRELLPVGIAAALIVVADMIGVGTALGLWPDLKVDLFFNVSSAVIPVSLLVAVGVRRVQRALATEDLVTNGQNADATRLVRSLRRAMGDQRLEVAVFSKETGDYLDLNGGPAPAIGPARRGLFVPAGDGGPLARLDIDARLADRPDLTESIFQAASLGLETVRLRTELALHAHDEAVVRAELEQSKAEGVALSRLLPSGLPEKLRSDPGSLGRIDRVEVTVLMSDVRGYSTIAERTPPERLAEQLRQHRAAMNDAVLAEGGTIMQYVGDAVMAVFGAPFPLDDHASRGIAAAAAMHRAQDAVNASWRSAGWEPFGLGIGLSTGPVATAVLGSSDRYEYTIVGDTVNLAQRLEAQARPAGTTIASAATVDKSACTDGYEELPPMTVKGRKGLTHAYRRSPEGSPQLPVTETVGVP